MTDYKLPELPEAAFTSWMAAYTLDYYTADQLRAMHRQGWDAAMAAVGAEVERLQVQLAGCGVAAMSNTRESLARAREVTPDSYGWSASYGDCIAAAKREIELREKLESIHQAGQATGDDAYLRYDVAATASAGYKHTPPQRVKVTRGALDKAWHAICLSGNAVEMAEALQSLGFGVEVEG